MGSLCGYPCLLSSYKQQGLSYWKWGLRRKERETKWISAKHTRESSYAQRNVASCRCSAEAVSDTRVLCITQRRAQGGRGQACDLCVTVPGGAGCKAPFLMWRFWIESRRVISDSIPPSFPVGMGWLWTSSSRIQWSWSSGGEVVPGQALGSDCGFKPPEVESGVRFPGLCLSYLVCNMGMRVRVVRLMF